MEKPEKLASIQALRAIAALLVLLFHAQVTELRLGDGSVLPGWFAHANGGVDLFFVISGFVMVWISGADRGPVPAASFLFSRAARIYPPALLFTTLAVLGSVAAGNFGERAAAENWLLFSYLMLPQETLPVLAVSWTIVHEVYFYLIFAVLLLIPYPRLMPAALIGWAAVVTLAGAAGWTSAGPWSNLVFSPLTLEFIAGALAAAALKHWGPWRSLFTFTAGLAMALAVALWLGTDVFEAQSQWGRVVQYGLPSIALIYGAAGLEIAGRFQCPRWLVAIGDISFSLYLSHLLVMAATLQIWTRIVPPGTTHWPLVLAMLIASLPVAAVSYIAFERPAVRLAHRARRHIFGKRTWRAGSAPGEAT
jgi:peptidoglycan/LPS O-acetylase OafA/YrhL